MNKLKYTQTTINSEIGDYKLYIQAGNTGIVGENGELLICCKNNKDEYSIVISERKTLLELLRVIKEALPKRG